MELQYCNLTLADDNTQLLMTIWQTKLDDINGQWTAEQLAHSPGLFALPHLTSVSVVGEDAEKFLQGQLTCDLNEVSKTQYRIGASCTPKGRMVAIFRLFKIENGYQFILDTEVADAFIKHLSKYIPFFQAQIDYTTPQQVCIGLSVDLHEISNLANTSSCNLCEFGSAKLMGYSENRWLLITAADELDKFWAQFQNRNLVSSSQDWQYLDIQQKLASVKASSIEKFLPHETGLPEVNGVSFTKGCYTGQEIVARMHYLGKLNKHIQLLEASSSISKVPGDSISSEYQGNSIKIGDLINQSINSSGETLILICLKDKFLELAEFTVNGENTSILKVI